MKRITFGLVLVLITSVANATPVFVDSGYVAAQIGTGTYNGFGTATATNGDVYFTSGYSNDIYRIDLLGNQSVFATMSSDSMGIRISGNQLFAGDTGGNLVSYDLTNPAPTAVTVATFSGTINDIAFAGSGSVYAGSMLIATSSNLYVYDQTTSGTGIVASGNHSSVEMLNDGGFVTASGTGVKTYNAGGINTATLGGGGYDGIAVHAGTGDVYLANNQSNSIFGLDILTNLTSLFASNIDFDGGWYPSPLDSTADGTGLIYGERNGGLWKISGFPSISVPAPSSLAFLMLGFLLSRISIRRSSVSGH